jgi:hypothetical protein
MGIKPPGGRVRTKAFEAVHPPHRFVVWPVEKPVGGPIRAAANQPFLKIAAVFRRDVGDYGRMQLRPS